MPEDRVHLVQFTDCDNASTYGCCLTVTHILQVMLMFYDMKVSITSCAVIILNYIFRHHHPKLAVLIPLLVQHVSIAMGAIKRMQ